MEDIMDTTRNEASADTPDTPDTAHASDGSDGPAHRAREVVTEVTEAARAAVGHSAPVVRDAAGAVGTAVGAHAPAVLEAGRATATSAYGQVRKAPDEQLALGTTFAAGLVTGLVLARVPRPLLLLGLVPLMVLGGTLLGRKVPFIGRAMRSTD